MTKTEILALAERLDAIGWIDGAEARAIDESASLLRKLAALEPVAWQTPENYSPDVGSWFEYYDAFRTINDTRGLMALYNLTGIIDHE